MGLPRGQRPQRAVLGGIAPQYIEQFRIVPCTFQASAQTIQRDCPSMRRAVLGGIVKSEKSLWREYLLCTLKKV